MMTAGTLGICGGVGLGFSVGCGVGAYVSPGARDGRVVPGWGATVVPGTGEQTGTRQQLSLGSVVSVQPAGTES